MQVVAPPTAMTFGDLSPDGSDVSPGTKRARAQTFNQDDGLTITRVTCEIESNVNLISNEEHKGTESSDHYKNLISGQEKIFNTKT